MPGSCDDCALLRTWEERYDFEGHGGEMVSECGLPDDLSKRLSNLFEEMNQ